MVGDGKPGTVAQRIHWIACVTDALTGTRGWEGHTPERAHADA